MEEDQSYRDVIREICKRHGFKPIDPWLREKVLYRVEDAYQRRSKLFDFIKRDLEDIERCDIIPFYNDGEYHVFYLKREELNDSSSVQPLEG